MNMLELKHICYRAWKKSLKTDILIYLSMMQLLNNFNKISEFNENHNQKLRYYLQPMCLWLTRTETNWTNISLMTIC